jgi:uncharacterized membrane protein YdbT with pleckstrin-like domain
VPRDTHPKSPATEYDGAVRETTGRRQRARSRVDAIDRTHEAQLETELEFRRAERSAIRARERAQRHARRRFVLAVLVLVALLVGVAYLLVDGVNSLFS